MTAITKITSNKIFGGTQKVFAHDSKELGCSMRFAIFIPPQCDQGKAPVIYWLSGLECTEANCIQKSGIQRHAAEHGVIIVCPDTSPRGLNLPGEKDSWDFGEGAGFYLDATEAPWNKNYRMYSYVTSELIDVVNANFPVIPGKQSIMGHSMGGHGALVCALKNPTLYKSVSAFAPICNPSQGAWGKKALEGYLGPQSKGLWSQWDATELVKSFKGDPMELFIDQGTADQFLSQLLPENLINTCKDTQMPTILKMREGYDHSYYYIATFIGEHVAYHAQHLCN
ncbi:hypothetical protein PPYR_08976 [Photinus pyralis]|uniref:S-formylglutathione hydrolase n=1 Tax=Photinus pyralis TaxID=7054 RepID=A0A1Y1MSA6_PHOPY|nr:S-formylglutathione hydrolase [Photinus pyralis]KAB0797983.1 hypothetical protein PPYR_08976 [Photinus pyralis]